MDRLWPFNFFPSMKEDDTSSKTDMDDTEAMMAELEAALEEELLTEDVPATEEALSNDADLEEENLPDLEEELEIALEKAHAEQKKKDRERTIVIAGLTLLGTIGLATGFGIRSYIKKRKK
jgi:hypothetical protein